MFSICFYSEETLKWNYLRLLHFVISSFTFVEAFKKIKKAKHLFASSKIDDML